MSWRGVWHELREAVTGEFPAGTVTNPSVSFVQLVGGGGTVSGVNITERIAEGLPAIYACVHVISETTGHLPLKLNRRLEGGGKKADPDHPVYSILHDQPNPEMTAFQFREMLTRHLAIWGRAYAQVQRNARGEVTALWPLHPARMIVERAPSTNRKIFRYWTGISSDPWLEFEHDPVRPPVLHLHINCDDGIDGRSPLLINRESLGITRAAEEYTGGWFRNGAIPGVVATSKGRLSPRAKENIRESWLKRFAGASNANKLAILEEGIAVEVVGVDPEKSQLSELRAAQIEAAARIYRVPLFLIQNQTKDTSWGSGIAEQMTGFVNMTMMPWFIQWQQAIRRDLLSVRSRETHEATFVINALVRGDIEKRFEAYQKARQNGFINGDEIRELEDLNPIEGGAGKVFWQPANMQPIGTMSPVVVEDEPGIEPVQQPEGVM